MPSSSDLTLRDVRYDDPLALALIDEIQAEMVQRYGGPDETVVDPTEFAPPYGVFVVAEVRGTVVGCAGLRRHSSEEVELKRMYVRAGYRRRGLARALLARLEDRARTLGFTRLVLETGTAQPEAMALYESAGYQRITGFGHYRDYDESRSYAKDFANSGVAASPEPSTSEESATRRLA